MQILKDIGSYAGIGAVVGLAVLSALYFSQARDVRRLREWAGRAPERAAEGTAQPVTAVPQAAKPAATTGVQKLPQPAAAAAKPAAAAAAGAAPATAQAKPAAATPAAQGKPSAASPAKDRQPAAADADGEKKPDESKPAVAAEGKPAEDKQPVGATAEAKPSAAEGAKDRQPAGVAVAAGQGTAAPSGEAKTPQPTAGAGTAAPVKPGDGAGDAPAKPGAGPPASPAKPADSSPATPRTGASTPAGTRPPQADPPAVPRKAPSGRPIPSFPSRPSGEGTGPSPSQTAILPPYGEEPQRPSLMRRTLASPRYLVLALAGVLIVGGAAAFGLNQLSKNEAPPPKNQPAASNDSPNTKKSKKKAAPINASNVTVSVLNGTTVPGLAAQIGDRITAQGFQLGNVTNSSDQQRAESVVLYAPGAEREAAFVGRKLGIAQRERMDPQSQALAGDARVVVITGADKTR